MKEYVEFRIIMKYAHLLFKEDEGVNLGDTVKKVKIDPTLPIYKEIGKMQTYVREKYDDLFFSSYKYRRIYTEKELNSAKWFRMTCTRHFEPAGEECGTIYDEGAACPICGAGAKQISPLKLKRSTIPRADMAVTIAWGEEAVVSEKFVEMVREKHLIGMDFEPVIGAGEQGRRLNYYQIRPQNYFDLSKETIFGINPFDFSGESPSYTWEYLNPNGTKVRKTFPPKIHKCLNGDNMGLNILSEAHVKSDRRLEELDFFASRQTVGGRMGLIRPYHLLFCSNRMMKLIKEYKLKGFKFEVAHIVDE